MSTVDDYIKQNAELHQFAAEVARIISGIPPMPEFSTERLTVDDVSKMIGIVYGWLPIGTATRNNKVVKSLTGEKTSFFISPRKLYEETGYVWKGKAALSGKETT